jgi:hypothetical protein
MQGARATLRQCLQETKGICRKSRKRQAMRQLSVDSHTNRPQSRLLSQANRERQFPIDP